MEPHDVIISRLLHDDIHDFGFTDAFEYIYVHICNIVPVFGLHHKKPVPWRQFHHHSGLVTLPFVGAIP